MKASTYFLFLAALFLQLACASQNGRGVSETSAPNDPPRRDRDLVRKAQ